MASSVHNTIMESSNFNVNSSIKELSTSGTLFNLPADYNSKSCEYSSDIECDKVKDVEIPVIDFSLLDEANEHRFQVVRELGKACEEWGFFMLVNHGVPNKLRNDLKDMMKGFFNLTAVEKQDYADTNPMNPIRHGTSFNAKVEDVKYWRDYVKIITHPEFNSPSKPPEFSEILRQYSTCTRNLGRKLLGAIWESLNLDEQYMNESVNIDSCFQIVVGNLYPPCPQPELAMGLPPHSDHGFLTILYQNDVDGLEIEHNGKWVRVNPLPNSFLINTGDHMEIVSNRKYKSVLHRAAVNGKSTRMSIVSVIGPSLDSVVIPAPPLVTDETPAVYRGVKYRDFMEYQQSNVLKAKSVLNLLTI